MANVENLRPKRTLSSEEAKRMAEASAAKRKKKIYMREAAQLVLSLGVTEPKTIAALERAGIKTGEMKQAVLASIALLQEAKKGNVGAYRALNEAAKEPGGAENKTEAVKLVNNLFEAIEKATGRDDDIPEIQPTPEDGADMVE